MINNGALKGKDYTFSISGATAHDVALMRQVVGPDVGVKAAGGIRTLADAMSMVAAGASRIGASASVKIMQEAEQAAPALTRFIVLPLGARS